MRVVADAEQKKQLDQRVQGVLGFPAVVLMEHAARSCWEAARGYLGHSAPAAKVTVVAGPGNNGGDGIALARQAAQQGYAATVILRGSPKSELAQLQLRMLGSGSTTVIDWDSDREAAVRALQSADCIVDALFGVGMSRPLDGGYREMAEAINAAISGDAAASGGSSEPAVIAIDLPSGLYADMPADAVSVRVDATAAVVPAAAEMYLPSLRGRCGKILFADAGFPATEQAAHGTAVLLDPHDIIRFSTTLAEDAYKNSRGHLCMYVGSPRYHGAAVLAAAAAGYSAVGRITMAVDPELKPTVRARLLSPVLQEAAAPPPAGTTAALAGCGWDRTPGRKKQLSALLDSHLPLVIDGDGLSLLAGQDGFPDSGKSAVAVTRVLTPHPGELAELCGVSVREVLDRQHDFAQQAAIRYRAVVVAKSHVTCIAHPDGRRYIIDGMEPLLGTAGSGDILAGLIAGELSVDGDALRAAQYGVLRHLEAGRRLHDACGSGQGGAAAEHLLHCLMPRWGSSDVT